MTIEVIPTSDEDVAAFACSQCKQDVGGFPLYVEWSTPDTVEDDGCVKEMFCSWDCAARWFCVQAGLGSSFPTMRSP